MPLIQTKTLIPKERKNLLHRPRLVDYLHQNIDRQLLLVSASAGYGKTTLLIDFARETELPVCWYTLDESDRDLRDFLEYFVASIEQVFSDKMPETRRALQNWHDDSQVEALSAIMVNEILLNIPQVFVAILDDFHLVDDVLAVNLFLDAFLRHQPDNCRLIIASRTIPTLTPRGMAMLVARQQIAGLGVNDLRFTPDEIRDLIHHGFGESLSMEQAEELARESEGWITAILLRRHRMWKGLFAGLIEQGSGSVGLYDYLANEVFEDLPPGKQQFLESTSILNTMSSHLCDALLNRDDSAVVLEQLEDQNLFISRVERGAQVWYRYHRLFREFLNSKLQSRDPGLEISLHIRAARFLEASEEYSDALTHYLEAGAYRDAVRVLEYTAEETYDAGRLESLLGWIDAIPEDLVLTAPRLAWFKAKILWNQGRLDDSIHYAAVACDGYARQGDQKGVAQALIEKSAVLRTHGKVSEALAECEKALAVLDGQRLEGRDVGILAGVYRNLGSCHWRLGDISQGVEELRKALDLYQKAGYDPNVAQIHNDLGVLLRTAGNLSASHFHFEQAQKKWEKLGNPVGIAGALNSIGVSYYMRGEYEKALDVYAIALKRAQEGLSDRIAGFVLAGIGDTYLALGEIDQALEAFQKSAELAERSTDTYLANYLLGAQAMAYLLRGESGKALDLARQAYELACEQGARQEAATHQIVLGAVYYGQGRSRRALDSLLQAAATLEESQAYRDLARVRLHLAMAYYRGGRLDEAHNALEELTDAILEVGQDHFLIPEARMVMPVLTHAVERNIGGDVLVGLVEHARLQKTVLHKDGLLSPEKGVHPATPPIRISALGETRIYRGDEDIPAKAWETVKSRQLFLYLLTFPGQRKETITEMFWPDLSPDKVNSVFHLTTFRVRKALGTQEAIVFENERYRISRNLDLWYDVHEFLRLLEEARKVEQDSPDEAAEMRREALEYVRGEFCADLPEMEWMREERRQLERMHVDTLLSQAQFHLQQNHAEEALSLARQVLTLDNLREDAHRIVMKSLSLSGDRAAALRHYVELEALLKTEIDAPPDPLTTRLCRQIAGSSRTRKLDDLETSPTTKPDRETKTKEQLD